MNQSGQNFTSQNQPSAPDPDEASSANQNAAPAISLPKGGGAIRGIDAHE